MIPDVSWIEGALCAQTDPEAFFPHPGPLGASDRRLKRICAACPVRRPCLEYALAEGLEYGVWGGLTARERMKLQEKALTPVNLVG